MAVEEAETGADEFESKTLSQQRLRGETRKAKGVGGGAGGGGVLLRPSRARLHSVRVVGSNVISWSKSLLVPTW